jgi:hypothetical protein
VSYRGVSRADGFPAAAVGGAENTFAGQKPIIRTLQPRPKDESSSQPIDILNLPRAAAEGDGQPAAPRSEKAGSAPWVSAADRSRYGYDTRYVWLRGKLEYTAADRRWKLRYIPVESENDGLGGSVVLSSSANLSRYEGGDFVEVRGRVQSPPKQGFAPIYEVAEIRPLGNTTR